MKDLNPMLNYDEPILTFPTKVPSDSLGWIGSLKRISDKSLFPMALGSCGHRITHQLRPINMNGRSILAVTSKLLGKTEEKVRGYRSVALSHYCGNGYAFCVMISRKLGLGACPNICSCSRMAAGFRWALAFSASAQPCARTIPLNLPRRCRSDARSSKHCGSSISVATRPTLSPGLATETCGFLART